MHSETAIDVTGPRAEQAKMTEARLDGGLGYRMIVGELSVQDELLQVIAERVRVAAGHLGLSAADLLRIFERHSVFEAEVHTPANGRTWPFMVVETHHLIQGKVGKGALKIVFPPDLLDKGPQFVPGPEGTVEVIPLAGEKPWVRRDAAEKVVIHAMRESMTGESLSMSLKCQATGAPFAGSEGLILCADREFDAAQGRFFLRPVLRGDEAHTREDRELVNAMMNATAELLTRAGRIAYDQIVHAAETNTTLTARLDLRLPTNVVEGHLRALLQADPKIIIGDEDMTPRLREVLARPDYHATACALAQAAARMQIEHSVLLQGSREKLRLLLSRLPRRGFPSTAQYHEIIDIFFGTGEIQQNEDQLFHHRELILKPLATALSTPSLDECGDPGVQVLYLKTLLDNQRVFMEAALLSQLGSGQALPSDWMDRGAPLSPLIQEQLAALMPAPEASRETVKENYWKIVRLLAEMRTAISPERADPFAAAKIEVIERAIRAITTTGDVLPGVDRVVFFTLPYTYECMTPRLGVVTRKPIEICGSALRPEAMAVGAAMTLEILRQKLDPHSQSFQGWTVAIEGLGNAGKNMATLLSRQGALVVGVSDSSGALMKSTGFSPAELVCIITHKDQGQRLNTLNLEDTQASTFNANPESLKHSPADILVLAAIPGSVHEANAWHLPVRMVCELSGAAVTGAAKKILHQRQIQVIPDNLASSGGLLVSLSEMLQNSTGQSWDRSIEELNLYQQLAKSFDDALKVAEQHRVDLPTASDILALRRMHELARYRERLERLAGQFKERVLGIRDHEQVIILSDNDEDGVASAAIMHVLIAHLNPAAAARIIHLNESFRAESVLAQVQRLKISATPIRHIFAVDRAFPLHEPGQSHIVQLSADCRITLVNNHDLPPELAALQDQRLAAGDFRSVKIPAELDILFISPQTLKSVVPAKDFLTALILRELAQQLVTEEQVLAQIDWQAVVGSFLDLPADKPNPWLLLFSRFNPDKILEASQAVRLVTRVGGYHSAVKAVTGVIRPDQLHTNEDWAHFLAEYQTLKERVQLLVEKIILENRHRPFTAHFFTADELSSPTPLAGDPQKNLDFYHWISERLTQHGNLAEKPIIVGQLVYDSRGREQLGVRIRSPRGIDLMEAGLPQGFISGGLPNTALARFPLPPETSPEDQFQRLVDSLWPKTTSSLYLGSPRTIGSTDGRLQEPAAGQVQAPKAAQEFRSGRHQ